ncbi:MAG: hypothetical protein DI539_28905, partial [Flavobacterium psychrophilum]
MFTKNLEELREYFHIPGMAVIVMKGDQTIYENYLGFADLENRIPMDPSAVIPMDSLSKIFSGLLVLALEKNGVLEKPIINYMPKAGADDLLVGDSILVKHVTTQTSQGSIGKNYYHSFRYSWLTPVIEKEYGESFERVMDRMLFTPLQMHNTFLLDYSTPVDRLVKPYLFDGQTKPGVIELGYSAMKGVASTVRDMTKLSKLLELHKNSFDLFEGHYNYGLFKQDISGHKVLWAYGQQECYSSLFIRVPENDLTLIMAANNGLMSDPARMTYGSVTNSLFALSFFKNFLNVELPREQLRAKAVAESFLAQLDPSHAEESKKLLGELFKSYPDYENYSDLTLLHNLIVLKYLSSS